MKPLEFHEYKKQSIINRYFKTLYSLKASDSLFLKIGLFCCLVFLLLFLTRLSTNATVMVPSAGGTLIEGSVGTPRFVNPVLAVTRADRDLTTLIYEGLLGLGENGVLIPVIAQSVTVSEDGLTYNIVLKNTVTFHDGTPLTADDVVFTVGRIKDPLIGSPLRANFDGVSIEKIDTHELNFILPESYGLFIENLTFGILPQHIWKDVGAEEFPFSQHNSEPIGSGPYMVQNIIRNTSGIPETYILSAYKTYHLGSPRIERLRFQFFSAENALLDAFKKGTIDSIVGMSPERIQELNIDGKTHHLERIPLPRTFALFMNQNKSPVLRDASARSALNVAIDRARLINDTIGGYGNPITSPIPPGFGVTITTPFESNLENARDILRNGGWRLNDETQIWEKTIDGTVTPLSFSISTINNSTFEATAEFLRREWQLLGAGVTIKQFEQSDLTQSIIRPRDYEMLLFGTQLGRSLDYYSFWHSSQRNDPGLNVSLYANITADSILTEMRRSNDAEKRTEAILEFTKEIEKETPAIFLYAPELLYIFPNHIIGATFIGVSEPSERFRRIHEWYIETELVWPFFTR